MPLFFILLIAILLVGSSKLDWVPKLAAVYVMTVAVAIILIYYFKKDETTEWGLETWDLTKKILPILVIGTFAVGIIAYYVPAESFRPYLGGNSLPSTFLASVIGALLYMPTLLEVPIIGTTFGYSTGVMGGGPALALLLTGPSLSLPSMVVLYKIMGGKKTLVYVLLVIVFSSIAGLIYWLYGWVMWRGNNMVSKIEVLGTGCAKCKRLEKNVREAVKELESRHRGCQDR